MYTISLSYENSNFCTYRYIYIYIYFVHIASRQARRARPAENRTKRKERAAARETCDWIHRANWRRKGTTASYIISGEHSIRRGETRGSRKGSSSSRKDKKQPHASRRVKTHEQLNREKVSRPRPSILDLPRIKRAPEIPVSKIRTSERRIRRDSIFATRRTEGSAVQIAEVAKAKDGIAHEDSSRRLSLSLSLLSVHTRASLYLSFVSQFRAEVRTRLTLILFYRRGAETRKRLILCV